MTGSRLSRAVVTCAAALTCTALAGSAEARPGLRLDAFTGYDSLIVARAGVITQKDPNTESGDRVLHGWAYGFDVALHFERVDVGFGGVNHTALPESSAGLVDRAAIGVAARLGLALDWPFLKEYRAGLGLYGEPIWWLDGARTVGILLIGHVGLGE